jgi:hypothetical protein
VTAGARKSAKAHAGTPLEVGRAVMSNFMVGLLAVVLLIPILTTNARS